MSSFYSNLAQKDTKKTKTKTNESENAIKKKKPKNAQKTQFLKSGYSRWLTVLLTLTA
jgi:hypothetical protein